MPGYHLGTIRGYSGFLGPALECALSTNAPFFGGVVTSSGHHLVVRQTNISPSGMSTGSHLGASGLHPMWYTDYSEIGSRMWFQFVGSHGSVFRNSSGSGGTPTG